MRFGSWARLGLVIAAMAAAPMSAGATDTPDEVAQREALNSEQARLAAQQLAGFEAERKAAVDAQDAKEAAYRAALAAHDADVAASQQRAAEAMARWEAAVAACKAGDRSQCAPPVKK